MNLVDLTQSSNPYRSQDVRPIIRFKKGGTCAAIRKACIRSFEFTHGDRFNLLKDQDSGVLYLEKQEHGKAYLYCPRNAESGTLRGVWMITSNYGGEYDTRDNVYFFVEKIEEGGRTLFKLTPTKDLSGSRSWRKQ